mmetsp:Transcript_43686/g.111672  ORF Transcript_43686/g.111672 Transcript_43686/m.111672 type:complete len:233 (-) Transcript_43686:330-1028(-)
MQRTVGHLSAAPCSAVSGAAPSCDAAPASGNSSSHFRMLSRLQTLWCRNSECSASGSAACAASVTSNAGSGLIASTSIASSAAPAASARTPACGTTACRYSWQLTSALMSSPPGVISCSQIFSAAGLSTGWCTRLTHASFSSCSFRYAWLCRRASCCRSVSRRCTCTLSTLGSAASGACPAAAGESTGRLPSRPSSPLPAAGSSRCASEGRICTASSSWHSNTLSPRTEPTA